VEQRFARMQELNSCYNFCNKVDTKTVSDSYPFLSIRSNVFSKETIKNFRRVVKTAFHVTGRTIYGKKDVFWKNVKFIKTF